MGNYFAQNKYVFLKSNFSHNGTTPEHPLDFSDLEAFGQNNYSLELADGGDVIDFIFSKNFPLDHSEIDLENILLIGHSRGGGIAILKAIEDHRIKKLVTLASVSSLAMWDESRVKEWKEKGVQYVYNGRTKQDMPLYYQLAEDYYQNEDEYNILKNAPSVSIPWLIIHGDEDETVPVGNAHKLHRLNPKSQLKIIEGSNHTLGGYHPYDKEELPEPLKEATITVDRFYRSNL
jgi:pimeloyl-ACP methyl ester carboxylesterase